MQRIENGAQNFIAWTSKTAGNQVNQNRSFQDRLNKLKLFHTTAGQF